MSVPKKRLTLGVKIALGFAALTAIAIVLGAVGYYGANRNAASLSEIGNTHFPALEATAQMREAAISTKSVLRTLLQRDLESSLRTRQFDLAAQARRDFDAAAATYAPLPKSAEESAIWQELTTVWADWQKANDEFFRLVHELDTLKVGDPIALERDLALFRGQHFELETKVFRACHTGTLFDGGTDHTACAFGKWLIAHPNHENPEIAAGLGEIAPRHQRFHAAAKQAKELIAAGNRDAATKLVTDEMEPDARATFDVFARMQRTAALASALNEKLNVQALQVCRVPQLKASELLDRLALANREAANTETQAGRELAVALKSVNLSVVLGGLLLAGTLAFFIVRSTSRSIRTVAQTLGDASTQVASAAAQVSSTSQTLAEGASEQAASLEETSAAIEEINGQAKQNADHGSHATELMAQKAATNFQILQDRSSRVQQAITSAVDSANKTSSIIKTIDEIAFQTNILALNAAVEAARAGEAGAGFAVVADEVRNLAQRAAAAAKETTATIDESNQRINDAQKLNEELSAALATNLEISQEITKLVTEIANASREQATGLAQTSTALQQMDRITQSNAANAEETAAASEELSTQSAVLLDNVRELLAVVGANQHASAPAASSARPIAPSAPATASAAQCATTATADPHFADF